MEMAVDSEKVRSEFQRIKSLGFVISDRPDAEKNDGAVGNTFETNLGVTENNLKDPDFEEWEVKTKRQFSKSACTLFSSKPTYPVGGDTYMRENYGVSDPTGEYPDIKVFRTSLYAHRWSTVYGIYKVRMVVDENNQRLSIELCDLDGNLIDDSVYWSFNDLQRACAKLKNTFVVTAEEKQINGQTYFHYLTGQAFIGFRFDYLITALKEGFARYDNRLGIYRSGVYKGRKHNHGGGIRLVSIKDYPKLFDSLIDLN